MYETSSLFQKYISSPDRKFCVKAVINGVEYDDKRVIQYELEDALTENSIFAIGSIVSSKLTIQVKTEDVIAPNAEIKPYIQLIGAEGNTEWVPIGTFYIDKRVKNRGVYEFTAYDRLIYANQKFDSSLTYPAYMSEVLDEILRILGIETDETIIINPAYEVPYKDEDITISEMLSYIASAHAACFKMSKDGKLKMIRPAEAKTPVTIGRNLYSKITPTNPIKTITKLRCIYNSEGEYLEIGEGTEATTLEFTNMYITEDMLVNIYNQLRGFSYLPITVEWRGNPAIEPGDMVSLEQVNTLAWEDATIPWQSASFRWDGFSSIKTIVFMNRHSFKGGLKMTSLSESDTQQESEFPFEGQLKRTIRKMVQKDVPYYGVTIGRANGLQIKRSDGLAEVTLNSDKMEFKANGQQALYFDINKKKFVFDGDIYAKNLLIGGSYGKISFTDLSDIPEDIIYEDDLTEVLSDYITNQALTTKLGQDYVVTGKIYANQVYGGTLSGVTINVNTDAIVGNTIRLGSTSNNVILENDSGTFYLRRNNDRVLKFFTDAMYVDGYLAIAPGTALGVFSSFSSNTMYHLIRMYSNEIDILTNMDMNSYSLRNVYQIIGSSSNDLNITTSHGISILAGNYENILVSTSGGITLTAGSSVSNARGIRLNSSYLSFFGGTPTSKTSISDPSSLSTGSAPSDWSQSWGNNVRTDLQNIRNKLADLIDALQSYNLI